MDYWKLNIAVDDIKFFIPFKALNTQINVFLEYVKHKDVFLCASVHSMSS
jgi:hypothetical protein